MKRYSLISSSLLLFLFAASTAPLAYAQEEQMPGEVDREASDEAASNASMEDLEEDVAAKQEEKQEEEKLKFKTGIISSTGVVGKNAAIETSALDGVPGEDQAAVSGSVTNQKGTCRAVLINNSKQSSYSVNCGVEGANQAGAVVFRKSFSARLSPGAKEERSFACREGLNMTLNVKSGKKLD